MRLDKALLLKFPHLTRSKATDLIKRRLVTYEGVIARKAGLEIDDLDKINIDDSVEDYVARSALKLKEALEEFSIQVKGRALADIGASTGGFTQLLLEKGATVVYAVDVGRDQLHPTLKSDARVRNWEKTNIKDVLEFPEPISMAVVDLSFISLRKVLKKLFTLLSSVEVDGKMCKTQVLALLKPQFEQQQSGIQRYKDVLKERDAQKILEDFLGWCHEEDMAVKGYRKLSLLGKKGNQEYFLHLARH